MSRSGYTDDCDGWDLIRWRGAVAKGIKGKRGQLFLKELEAALLALPKKELITESFASSHHDGVCAIGSVILSRKMATGLDRDEAIKVIEEEWPEDIDECEEAASERLNISGALAKEIMFMNDSDYMMSRDPKETYRFMLEWVRENIITEKKA